MSRRRREMYCGHPRLFVCLSAAACRHYCTYPDVTWGSGRACSEVVLVHYWVDLQSVHGLRCYGNITRTRNVSEYMFVLALCLVSSIIMPHRSTTYVDAAYCYWPSSVACLSVGLSVCHSSEPCENNSTDRDAVWVEDSGWPKKPCRLIRCGPHRPIRRRNF